MRTFNNIKYISVSILFFYSCLTASIAFAATETYSDSITQAYNNAANPSGWLAPSSSIISITSGDTHGLQYDTSGNLIVRTLTSSWKFFNNYVGQANYKTYYDNTQASGGASWVTTGNDLTNLYDTKGNGATGLNAVKVMERGLGMDTTGTHDAVIEFSLAATNANLMRPTANPDITSYNPAQYGSSATLQGSAAFQAYYQ